HDFEFEFVGLIGFLDPVRPSVRESVRECYDAGIRVIMITGDYPGTARNIAHQIGLRHEGDIITGPELESMNDEELQARIRTTNIFARVVPEQKLHIVNALKANGEIVAMTGDGVNDAPALKSANIGVAMGKRGTDVARECSSIVLLDDDFSSIVRAVRMGRRLLDNIKKAMAYIVAVHMPIVGLSLIPVILNWPLALLPIHVVFLELIIDPACSIVFEAEGEEADVMRRKPRNPKKPLFDGKTIGISVLQGLSVLIIALVIYGISLSQSGSDTQARALAFTTVVIANLALILTNLSWSKSIFGTLRSPNRALWWIIAGAVAVLSLVLSVPFLRELFHFAPLHADDLALCLLAGLLSVAWFEILKMMNAKRKRREGAVSP
ncbi:MAG: cation-translocating P-type ATPase, partial [Candidatus Micrarchaeota archaeon]|nr:cation-translocating P-type ATPase [Candidatus Micrarchaeota archaeon]